MEEEKKPKGGKRVGAGRKKKDGVGAEKISVRINNEHKALIQAHYPNMSEFICKAVKEKLRRAGLL